MANRIKVALTHSIITRYNRGWSKRRIARELGLDRETISRYIRLELEQASKPTIPTAGSGGRDSHCKPYQEQIDHGLQAGLTAQRIYQDLVLEHGFTGSYEAVKRYVRHLRIVHPGRVYRVECLPGEEAQVDFCAGAPILNGETRKRRRPPCLRVTLSFSRKGYSEAIPRQTTEGFIRCLENAYRAFRGIPASTRIDNLKAAVKKADWFDPELNPKVEEFARYYGTVILPTRPYSPEHKGKVENNVNYLKDNALKGRVFASIEEENRFLRQWEATVADTRIHGTTREQVKKRFEEYEQPALKPLPLGLFPCFEEGQRTVHRDSYVEVGRAYYEVPEEYIGKRVWVRWDSHMVRVYNQRFEQIRMLPRLPKGTFSASLPSRLRQLTMGCTLDYWLEQAGMLGVQCGKWARALIENRGPLAVRVLMGLLSMRKKHSPHRIDHACGLALSHGVYRLREVRRLLEIPTEHTTFEFMDAHPLIRDMAEYEVFMKNLLAMRKEVAPV
ncbi:MAG: IS21 family transposase [bacterium]|nr:IS21 family transposase [bacterium]